MMDFVVALFGVFVKRQRRLNLRRTVLLLSPRCLPVRMLLRPSQEALVALRATRLLLAVMMTLHVELQIVVRVSGVAPDLRASKARLQLLTIHPDCDEAPKGQV